MHRRDLLKCAPLLAVPVSVTGQRAGNCPTVDRLGNLTAGAVCGGGPDTELHVLKRDGDKFELVLTTSVEADRALITVFYNVQMLGRQLLRSQERVFPVAGPRAASLGDPFELPFDRVAFARVLFLKDIDQRRVEVAAIKGATA